MTPEPMIKLLVIIEIDIGVELPLTVLNFSCRYNKFDSIIFEMLEDFFNETFGETDS